MPNPVLLENYKVDILETLQEETIYFRITSKGNSNSFTYLSKYIFYFFDNDKSFTKINLAIDDDVENFDLKTLGLLILYCEYLNKKELKCKLNIFYNEISENPSRNIRFHNLLNTLIEKPVFLFSNNNDSKTYFETVKKENTKKYSSRTFPFLLINEFTFESLFIEILQHEIQKINLTQSDITYENTSDLTFKKNIKIQINKLQELDFHISKFDFLLLKFESIFNYSHFTNLFTNFPETVKRFYPNGIDKLTYNGNTTVIANFVKDRLLKWNYCKGILFLYLFLSEYEQYGYDKGFSPSKLNEYLNNLESYVDELNVLLREASKNIIKHSSSKMGMITIRLSSDLITSYDKPLSTTQDNLQIGVFDLSNCCVIDKFKSDTENLISEYEPSDSSISQKLRFDLETLKTDYTFKDLLDKSTSKTLLHQSIRMIGHFGIKIIVEILLRNNAILGFSSINNKNINAQDSGYFICEKGHQEYLKSEWYYCGTGYEIILDTRKKYKEKIIPSVESNEWKDTDATEIIKFLKNDIIEVNLNLDVKTISDKNIKITAKGLELEEIIKKIKAIEFKNKNEKQFLLLDETNVKVKDASELIRTLEKLSYNINIKNLIISGLETSLVTELISLAIMTISNNWESKNTLLFYHKNDKKQYASILAGTNLIETYSAIKLLSNSYLIDNASKEYLNKYEKDYSNIVPPRTSVIKNNNILPFDLFIKSDDKLIYFNFISQLLNEEVENGGYKISGGHFKLGSKAHIEDFIYAQRIFQFSSHSSRFAYLCSEKIKEKVAPNTNKKLLIISYGYYSEMLITKTVNYLKSSYYQVDYNLVSDSSKPYFIRDFTADTPLKNYEVVIVVPIATTLSTAIKIRKHLIGHRITKNLKNNIHAYINFILIAGETKEPNGKLNDIAQSFGWIDNIDNDNNTISVRTQGDDKNEIQQNFFLFIKSTWHLNSDCKLCYPENREEEKVILTTDKTSVNPEFIIKLTKRFKKEEYIIPQDKEIFLPSSAYSRRHIEDHNKRHYIHYLDANPFYETHHVKIKEWLENVKKYAKSINKDTLIITPAREHNLYFINLVNEIIFNNNAKILQYSTEKSFNQNNQIFFEKIIKSVDQIYFVDDFIQSGNTFLRVHNFVRQSKKSIEGLICMLNKTDRFGQATIKQYLPTIDKIYPAFFPFHDVNVKAVKAKTCAMCIEKELYLALAEESVLDAIKISFLKRARKLQHDKKGANNSPKEDYKKNLFVSLELFRSSEHIPYNDFWNDQVCLFFENNHNVVNKHYIKFLCRHFLNKYISEINETEDEKEYLHINKIQTKIINDCNRVLKIQVNKKNPENYLEVSEKEEISNEKFIRKYIQTIIDELVIKVLIQPEFKNYITIRKNTAEYVTKKLIELETTLGRYFEDLENLNLNENRTISNYSDIDYIIKGYYLLKQFKFYLRRSVLLQMNFCIHEQTLLRLKGFYSNFEIFRSHIKSPISELINLNGGEKNNLKSKLLKEILYNLSTFNYYYVSLVKELIHYEPIKAIRVEKTIKTIKTQINSKTSLQYGRLIDLISYENTGIFNKGIKKISKYFTNVISQDKQIHTFSKAAPKILNILIEKYKTKDSSRELTYFFEFIEFDDSISSHNDYRGLKSIHIYTLRTVYLYVLLNSKEQFEFPRVIKAVTRNLQRIVCDTTTNVEKFKSFLRGSDKQFNSLTKVRHEMVMAVIRSKNHNRKSIAPTDLKIVGISNKYFEAKITDKIDKNSLAYISMKGISKISPSIRTHTDVIPENTITKYKFEKNSNHSKKLICLQGTRFYSNESTEFPNLEWHELKESSLFLASSSVLTFKINTVELEPEKKYYEDLKDHRYPINIYPQAIFTMASLKEEFEHERIRLMLTLRFSLSNFFKNTFESNAYAELLLKEENNIIWRRDTHSINHFIEYVNTSLEKIKNSKQNVTDETLDCLKIILYATQRGNQLLTNTKQNIDKDSLESMTKELFTNIYIILDKNQNSPESITNVNCIFDDHPILVVDKYQIGFILFEILYNMIKHFKDDINTLHPKLIIKSNTENCNVKILLSHRYFNLEKSIDKAIHDATNKTQTRGTDMLETFLKKLNSNNSLSYNKQQGESAYFITEIKLFASEF